MTVKQEERWALRKHYNKTKQTIWAQEGDAEVGLCLIS